VRAPLLAALLLAASAAAAGAQSRLLVVSGLGGEPRFSEEFRQWGATMVDAAASAGLPRDAVVWLAEAPEADRQRISGRSTKENVQAALRAMARAAGPSDRVLVLLIGHGSVAGGEPRLNLPGPDLTATELARMLEAFPTQEVAVVNAASASGDFQQALEGEHRTVVTATKSGLEGNETVFGGYFVGAFAGGGADADKDGRVSLLEAYQYATSEVERHYKDANHLQTEHAALGGSRDDAAAFVLAAAPAAASPELRALLGEKQRLEAEVEALKARKDGMDAARYQAELEDLLVKLALKSKEIREKGGG
jgi:hypothetical protein